MAKTKKELEAQKKRVLEQLKKVNAKINKIDYEDKIKFYDNIAKGFGRYKNYKASDLQAFILKNIDAIAKQLNYSVATQPTQQQKPQQPQQHK